MIKGIYSVNDRLNGFMSINLDDNDDMAVRGFMHAIKCAPKDSFFLTNPDDYSIYKLGTFDTDSGEIKPCVPPVFLLRGNKNED